MDGCPDLPRTKARIMQAERLLLDGIGVPTVRRTIEQEHNLSQRQARTIVSEALTRLSSVWDVERQQMLAARLVQLEKLAEQAIAAGQLKTALAAWIHADKLMQLTEPQKPNRRHP